MPILEYVCKECAHEFETIVQGAQIPACPTCKSRELERRLSVFAVGTWLISPPERRSVRVAPVEILVAQALALN